LAGFYHSLEVIKMTGTNDYGPNEYWAAMNKKGYFDPFPDPAKANAGVNGGQGMGPSYIPGWGLYCKLLHEAEAEKAAKAAALANAPIKTTGDISTKAAPTAPKVLETMCQL
jgi:hypothetical protein